MKRSFSYLKKIFFALILMFGFTVVVACTNPSDNQGDGQGDGQGNTEEIELKFKSAVLIATENEGELKVKAEINGDKGTIYYIVTESSTTPTAAQVVAGVNFDQVVVDKKGDSGTNASLEETISDLTAGVKYYAYFAIKYEDKYSDVVSKNATTYQNIDKGAGTEEDPFKVSTVEDLEHVGAGLYTKYDLDWTDTSYYILENNIDLSEKYGEGKENWAPLYEFKGHFDGNNMTISGLYINDTNLDSGSLDGVGLFQKTAVGSVVKNLTLDNVYINANSYNEQPKDENNTSISGIKAAGLPVGSLVGSLQGLAQNITITNAEIVVTGSRTGGLAGRMYTNCSAQTGIEDAYVEASIKGGSRIGGIVGHVDVENGTELNDTTFAPYIKNVIFKGSVEGETIVADYEVNGETITGTIAGESIGGIVGWYRACTIENAYSEATLSGAKQVGGIVGYSQYNDKSITFPVVIRNTLFQGTCTVDSGSNVGPVTGNNSTKTVSSVKYTPTIENAFYLSTSSFISGENSLVVGTDATVASTANYGVSVAELTTAWYEENLPTFIEVFDFDANNLPILK